MKLNINMGDKLLIKNGMVWNGESFSECDVLIENGIITKMEAALHDKAASFDAKNMIVSSGLIDFHTHIKGISPDRIGIERQKASYPFGVTGLVDASANMGCKADILNCGLDMAVIAEVTIVDNSIDFTNAEKMLSAYGDRLIGIKVYFDTSFNNVWGTAALEEACRFAKKHGLFVTVHTTHSPVSMAEIVTVLRKGDVIAHAFHGGEKSCAEDGFSCLEAAREKGIYTDAALASYYHIDYEVFKRAAEEGVYPDIISTDITRELEVTFGKSYGLTVCMSLLRELGMEDESIFKAVTVNPAAILKTKANSGYLRVGSVADIAVLKNEPCGVKFTDTSGNTVELKSALECALTLSNGKIVYKRD